MRKFIILLIVFVFLLIEYNTFAFEIVSEENDIDLGFISSSFLKQGREADRAIRYSPWLINYALQTEEEAQVVKGGEGFQQISDIAISPVDNNLMIMGTDTCGIWRSEDGGNNWLSVNDGVNCWGVHDIIFHPSRKNTAYMIQGGPNSSVATNQIQGRTNLDGFYKSEDGGKSWKQLLDVNIRGSLLSNRLIAFDDRMNLYLLTSEGLLMSTDSGETWNILYSLSDSLVNYDLCISGNTIVFTNDNGVFVSLDGGVTWDIRNVNSLENIPAQGIDIDPENISHWIVCFGEPFYEVYETFNSGRDWNLLSVGASADLSTGKQPVKIMFGKRNKDGIRRIYVLFRRFYTPLRVSTDDGETWNEASYTTPWDKSYYPFYGHAISLEHSETDTVFLGVGTIMKSADGGQTFSVRNTPGYSGANIEEIRFSDSGKLHLSTTDHGYYKSTGKYEKQVYPTFHHTRDQHYSDVGDIGIDPHDENHVIYAEARTEGFSLRESNDGGLTWSKINGTGSSAAPRVIKFHKDEDIIYSTYFTSRDGGITWNANEKNIYAVSDADNDIVYSYNGNILYKSFDCGITFSELYTADWPITYILPDNTNPDIVYIGIKNGNVVKIESGQTTVMNENNGLSNVAPYAIAQNPYNPQHIVMGGQCVDYSKTNKKYYDNYCKTPGLYETFNGGVSWHIVKGMPSMRVIYSLAFSHNSSEIFIGGYTGGLLVYDYEAYKDYLDAENSINEGFVTIFNSETNKVNISGSINAQESDVYSTILVLPNDIMPDKATKDNIIYLSQVKIEADGSFEYEFRMPEDCDEGVYSVYLGGSGVKLLGVDSFNNGFFEVCDFEFLDGDNITASLSVSNTTDKSKNCVLLIAQYDKDSNGNLILVDLTTQKHSILPGEGISTKTVSAKTNKDADCYKAFAWESMYTMVPLTEFIER